jgi:hypothetical protein
MKALPKKLLPLALFAIAATSLFSVLPAQAYTLTLEQLGANVVATGSGAFNLNGLNIFGSGTGFFPTIVASTGQINTGPIGSTPIDFYTGLTGPASFGSGGEFDASFGSGNFVVIAGTTGFLIVPQGYTSGTLLSSSATWNNTTLASLGVTPGTYVWSWGDGANQNFTLIIEAAGVPDGGTTVCLLGCALLGLVGLRRRLSC